MGAVAISVEDEDQISLLMTELGAKSKAQVVREALRALRAQVEREKLRTQIVESVSRCGKADRRENRLLGPSGVAGRA